MILAWLGHVELQKRQCHGHFRTAFAVPARPARSRTAAGDAGLDFAGAGSYVTAPWLQAVIAAILGA